MSQKGLKVSGRVKLTWLYNLEDTRMHLLPDVISGPAEQRPVVQLSDGRVVDHWLRTLNHVSVKGEVGEGGEVGGRVWEGQERGGGGGRGRNRKLLVRLLMVKFQSANIYSEDTIPCTTNL